MANNTYKKREGTDGINGKLYETKLLSLVSFRLLHKDNIEYFSMATNMADVGTFDDICLRIKLKHVDKTLLVMIQAKHKDDGNLELDKNNDLSKWADSIWKIKKQFSLNKNTGKLFSGEFDKTECYFVIYSNAEIKLRNSGKENKDVFRTCLNEIIGTGNEGYQPGHTEAEMQDFGVRMLSNEIVTLAERFAMFLNKKQSMNIMNDEYILRYHIILATKVIKVSDIQSDNSSKWRNIEEFKSDFFNSQDQFIALFRSSLLEQIRIKMKTKAVEENRIDKDVISEQVKFPLKVPMAFGNLDLAIRGNNKDVVKRLNHLTNTIADLCKKADERQDIETGEEHKIIIDETFSDGLLNPNGGLAGCVGNLLILDETNNLLQFSDNYTSRQKNAQDLCQRLKNSIHNLHEYKIEVKTRRFPRLNLDSSDIAKEFLDKLMVFEKQGNHNKVENILKEEIEFHERGNAKYNLFVKPETVFLNYHNEIQKWWLLTKNPEYITEESDIYTKVFDSIIEEPQIGKLQTTFYLNKVKNDFIFDDAAFEPLRTLDTNEKSVIMTDVTTLTAIKVVHYLACKDKSCAVLDLENMLNLPTEDLRALCKELKSTKKAIVIVCDVPQSGRALYKTFDELEQATADKKVVVVSNKTLAIILREYFPKAEVFNDDELSLNHLKPTSRTDIIESATVMFQGHRVLLFDEESVAFTKGSVLNKLIKHEEIVIGESLTNPSYEEIKQFYFERSVRQANDVRAFNDDQVDNISTVKHTVTTFHDIDQDTVLLTAAAGMGKSTLLTHLSLKTKEIDPTLWIARINLLDHSKQFHDWQRTNTDIDNLETLRFLCRVVLKNNDPISLKEVNNKIVQEKDLDDEHATFGISVFLNLFNKGKLIFVFDGVDEVCPYYKTVVVQFLSVVANYPNSNKTWVTTRPYREILPDLEAVLGKAYKIEYMDEVEQEMLVHTIWRAKLQFTELSDDQLHNVLAFFDFLSQNAVETKSFSSTIYSSFPRVYLLFYEYLLSYFPRIETREPFSLFKSTVKLGAPLVSSNNRGVVDKLAGSPLLMYLLADYFVNVSKNQQERKLNMNLINIYDMFVQTKLKTILFEDKNKMDTYKPNIMSQYDKEYADCVRMHKMLAAQYILRNKVFFDECALEEFKNMRPFREENIHEFDSMIELLKSGKEKTGLISHVTLDSVPVFIHRTFAEYFAVEYLADLLKNERYEVDDRRLLLTAIHVYGTLDVRPWLNEKREVDRELSAFMADYDKRRPIVSGWQRELFSRGHWSVEHLIRLLNSTRKDYRSDWLQFTDSYIHMLNSCDPPERQLLIKKLQKFVLSQMKSHLRKHFKNLVLRGTRQMINWMDGKISFP